MTPDKYFDKIYILNLKTETKRWNLVENLLKKHNITNYVRFEAINGYTEQNLNEWKQYSQKPFDDREKQLGRKKIGSPGVWGNLKSLIAILQDFKKKKYKKILFMEDDILLHKNFNEKFSGAVKEIPQNWILLYLGANDPTIGVKNNKIPIIKNTYYHPHKNLMGGFAVAINECIIDELLKECQKFNWPFDSGPLPYILNKYPSKCLVLYPNLIVADLSQSCIRENLDDSKVRSLKLGWNLNDYDQVIYPLRSKMKPVTKKCLYIYYSSPALIKYCLAIQNQDVISRCIKSQFENFGSINIVDYQLYDLSEIETIVIDALSIIRWDDKHPIYSFLSELDKIEKLQNRVINKYFLFHDLHEKTFDCSIKPDLTKPVLPSHKGGKGVLYLYNFCKKYNITNLITLYRCQEFINIVNVFGYDNYKYYEITHHVDDYYFKKLEKNKINDIIMYGETLPSVYPLRYRIKNIVTTQFTKIDIPGRNPVTRQLVSINADLSKRINNAWIGISTMSNFSYCVNKYFEIGSCGTCVAGNFNSQTLEIFRDNIIYLSHDMSDQEIFERLNFYLSNKKYIFQKINNYDEIEKNYTYKNFAKKIYSITQGNKQAQFKKINKFLIVTLVRNDLSAINEMHTRELFYTYKNFNDIFDVIDIRDYEAKNNNYEVTILDQFSMFAYLKSIANYSEFCKKFVGTKNLVLFSSDLHFVSIFPGTEFSPTTLNLEHLNDYTHLFEMFKELNIFNMIGYYDCPELHYVNNNSSVRTYIVNYHINPKIYRDYNLPKIYDVVFYGSINNDVYPFQFRLENLLKKSGFNVKFIEHKYSYDLEICGENLAKIINQSWLSVATTSNFDYLIGKYFEISACNTVVLGNMNNQGQLIWNENYIHINDEMSDSQILEIIKNALSNKPKLMAMAKRMSQVIHSQHTLNDQKIKLFEICHAISSNKTSNYQFNRYKFNHLSDNLIQLERFKRVGSNSDNLFKINKNKLEMGGNVSIFAPVNLQSGKYILIYTINHNQIKYIFNPRKKNSSIIPNNYLYECSKNSCTVYNKFEIFQNDEYHMCFSNTTKNEISNISLYLSN